MRKSVKSPIFQYGIKITKPWSTEMYAHNDKVKKLQKAQISDLLEKFSKEAEDGGCDENLHTLGKIVCGYGFGMGYDTDEMTEQISRDLENAQSFWMNGDVWPDVLEKDWVTPIDIDYIGY